jgi:hypothetical protein
MKRVFWWNLESGREYFIERNNQLRDKYKLIFRDLYGPSFDNYGSSESAWFVHKGFNFEFDRDDIFYDVEEIRENAKKAKQSMEKRALDKILKQIVNETFEW